MTWIVTRVRNTWYQIGQHSERRRVVEQLRTNTTWPRQIAESIHGLGRLGEVLPVWGGYEPASELTVNQLEELVTVVLVELAEVIDNSE